ncbi:hypothetical protein [Ensifer soli]|uniref:hypothetical protein n=1 Tax=Ciceribacter sp. sgz301302 TaxID=3342379 RepID=UPI0035BAB9AC
MKGSLATSAVLHAAAIAFALVSIGSPEKFEVADVEALPVDIVPVESITQTQQGVKDAPKAERSSPTPSEKPQTLENAQNAGENEIDLKTPPRPQAKPVEQETAAAPEKTVQRPPTPDPVPEEVKEVTPEPAAEPATEVAALPEPKVDVTPIARPEVKPEPVVEAKPEAKPEVKPEPVPEAQPEAKPEPAPEPVEQAKPEPQPETAPAKPTTEAQPETPSESAALPNTGPVPVAKPKAAAQSQTAKTPDRRNAESQTARKSASSSKESDFNADEIATLLNKQDASGGGAKRSTETASLGTKKSTGGNRLSQSEMDALRGQIQQNWSIIPGMADAQDVRITVTIQLDPSGEIVGTPKVEATGGSESARRALAGGARRAVLKSAPFKGLPADKYDSWNEVVINFDPSSMY